MFSICYVYVVLLALILVFRLPITWRSVHFELGSFWNCLVDAIEACKTRAFRTKHFQLPLRKRVFADLFTHCYDRSISFSNCGSYCFVFDTFIGLIKKPNKWAGRTSDYKK